MGSETNPAEVLFAESQRLEAFAGFWRDRIATEKAYLDNLSGLQIPELSGNDQLQELATKTRELLHDELEERRRGFAKLHAAYKVLRDKLGEETAAETATAESITERLAVLTREKENPPMPSSAKSEDQPRSGFLSRLIVRARNGQPHDNSSNSSFLSADSAYRQKVQEINDEKYVSRSLCTAEWEHQWKCIVALKQVVSAFSAVHSDLAQVLNVTSSQLCNVSSSVDASIESASFSERLDASVAPLIQRYRYTSHDISSSLRPTTMLFGCPLPDELDGASIGQRNVYKAFEAILLSAAKHPQSFFEAIRDAHEQQSNVIKLSALQLETLWDPSQENGGNDAIDYLDTAPGCNLLVYFLSCLPTPLWQLRDSDIGWIIRLPLSPFDPVMLAFSKAGNRMSIQRRRNLARLLLTFRHLANGGLGPVLRAPESISMVPGLVRILTGITDVLVIDRLAPYIRIYAQIFE